MSSFAELLHRNPPPQWNCAVRGVPRDARLRFLEALSPLPMQRRAGDQASDGSFAREVQQIGCRMQNSSDGGAAAIGGGNPTNKGRVKGENSQ